MSRILISLPDNLLQDVDNYCKENKYLRSEFIRHIIRYFLYPDDFDKEESKKSNDKQTQGII